MDDTVSELIKITKQYGLKRPEFQLEKEQRKCKCTCVITIEDSSLTVTQFGQT